MIDVATERRPLVLEKLKERLVGIPHVVPFQLFYLFLLLEYWRFVYANYAHQEFYRFSIDPLPIITGLLLESIVVALLFFFKHGNSRLYAFGMVVALFFCLPQIVMYQFGSTAIYGSLYAILLLFFITYAPLRIPTLRLPRVSVKVLRWLLPAITVLALVPFVFTFGIPKNLSVFSMGEVIYDVREGFVARSNWLHGYLLGPLTKVLLPILIVFGLCNPKGRWWMLLLGMVAMLYVFLINPEKSIFFSIGIVVLCSLFRSYYNKAGALLYSLLGVGVAVSLLNLLTGNLMAESIAIRRVLFVPALLTDKYFSFFNHSPLMLSHSVLGHWIQYQYYADPSRLMGDVLFGVEAATNCNTGIIADGFSNFGHVGALFFVALAAFVIHLMDAADADSHFFGLPFLTLFTFLNSALFTTMLTHGGLMCLLALFFLVPSAGDKNCDCNYYE